MEERNLKIDREDIYQPNGKTGVAIGLILSRPGSQILVKNFNVDDSGEVRFRYIVGKDTRGQLMPIINFSTGKGKWVQFKRANEKTIEFYFTSNASGLRGDFDISRAERRICELQGVKPNAFVYICWDKPTEMQYKIAINENSKPLWPIGKINLKEDG